MAHKYNLQRAIDTIARIQPDLVALQEVTRNHPFYDCDDQPARIAAGLKAATGREWFVVYQQEWFTPNVECQERGKGDGKETEGLAFLSPQSTRCLDDDQVAGQPHRADGKTGVGGRHRDHGDTPRQRQDNGPARANEVEALIEVDREARSERSLLLGDFNLEAG